MSKTEALLARAAADPHATAWDELYVTACHYGFPDMDEATLLPCLADIAARFEPSDRDNVLILAGQIATRLDETSWPLYAEPLTALQHLAAGWAMTPTDPPAFIYRLRAVMALDGDEVWGTELDRIGHGEIETDCPACGTSLFVVFGDHGCFATHEDYATRSDVEKAPLFPAEPTELDGAGRRLYSLSVQAGQHSVATTLMYLFGRATCTQCGTEFRVSEQVERRR
ncbi:hypothetical protein [Catellatospora chokoriensis]|uniref:Uncharacterized protein n=1 Tax=Catellatospora chokoriensis TaxID=310353 RepID=A0A8J3NV63_9ACTN|nr:hypothetical protein [Catellatospora chokoriensis]GIF93672.1 hypothetical protein Cch02nite_71160 [Catellatospora chokoriensis]